MKIGLFLVLILLISGVVSSQENVIKRTENKELISAISGALIYLEDNQIRSRPGKNWAVSDSTEEGDGAKGYAYLKIPFLSEKLKLPVPKNVPIKNKIGEWASEVHFVPKRFGIKGDTAVSVQDSNLFMTAFITYPFYLFEEERNGPNYLRRIKRYAMENVKAFKRGDAYNFWDELPGTKVNIPRTGPYNIPVDMVDRLAKAYVHPKLQKFWSFFTKGLITPPVDWIHAVASKNNVTGADALFNIPNDADDTSTAVAIQYLFSKDYKSSDDEYYNNPKNFKVDLKALKLITKYRDINRTMEDGRDSWKGKDSGAFLTWMKSETEPTFQNCQNGVIPLGINNVDCVVNANVLFSFALNGMKDAEGFVETINLMKKAVESKAWPEAGLYYPQKMIFPYSVTRAFRDGNINDPVMRETMKLLLKDLLKIQVEYAKENRRKKGAFPGGEDKKNHLSTALGLISLLNIGEDIAIECNLKDVYNQGIELAVKYLLKEKKPYKVQYPTTFSEDSNSIKNKRYGCKWDSGLFFSASFWDLAHWRSQPFTVAIVLEALGKYMLGYDKNSANIADGPKIHIIEYPQDYKEKPLRFIIK